MKRLLFAAAFVAAVAGAAYGQFFNPPLVFSANVDCTGGTITHSGGNTIHTFSANDTLACTQTKTAHILVVAGGGGGGGVDNGTTTGADGGGGAGGYIDTASQTITGGSS